MRVNRPGSTYSPLQLRDIETQRREESGRLYCSQFASCIISAFKREHSMERSQQPNNNGNKPTPCQARVVSRARLAPHLCRMDGGTKSLRGCDPHRGAGWVQTGIWPPRVWWRVFYTWPCCPRSYFKLTHLLLLSLLPNYKQCNMIINLRGMDWHFFEALFFSSN